MEDRALLEQFVREKSQTAFAELARRHTDWVYSVCRRRLRDASLAEDATQAVFLALAQKAPGLLKDPTLSPWLYQAAHFAANNILRSRARRARHEGEAAAMKSAQITFEEIETDLEPAIDALGSKDRQAILLRFYEQKSLGQIASALDISEDAAQKRVTRAVGRLREQLTGGGTTIGSAALSGVLLSYVVAPAPTTLAATIGGLTAATIPTQVAPVVKGIIQMAGWIKLQFAAVVAVAVLATGAVGTAVVKQVISASPTKTVAVARQIPLVTAPAAAPATLPAIHAPLTPVDTLWMMNQAIASNDVAAITKIFIVKTDDEKACLASMQEMVTEFARMLSAYKTKIDPQGTALGGRRSLNGISEELLRGAQVTMLDDRTADVFIPGVSRFRTTRDDWGWHIEFGASYGAFTSTDPLEAIRVETAQGRETAAMWRTVTDQINGGTLTSADQVTRAVADANDKIKQAYAQKHPPAVALFPYRFGNYVMLNRMAPGTAHYNDYAIAVDPEVKRTPDSGPAGHMRSIVSRPTRGFAGQQIGGSDWANSAAKLLRGKRISMTCWIKSKDVQNWCGADLIVVGADGKYLASADNAENPITGTTDWQQIKYVADVPQEASEVYCSAFLRGTGEIWFDEYRIEIVPDTVPINDDQTWQRWSGDAPRFASTLDQTELHNGNPTVCIFSSTALPGMWCAYGRNNRSPQEYIGKRLHVSAWIKTENADAPCGINVRLSGANDRLIGRVVEDRHTTGTTDWHECSFEIDVPPTTQDVVSNFMMYGQGKMWADVNSMKIEIVGDAAPAQP